MGGLRREDEQKLKELTELCVAVGYNNLPEDDQLMMLYLEDRYDHFLVEGLRKLRGEPDANTPKGFRSFFQRGLTHDFSTHNSWPKEVAFPNKNQTTGPHDEKETESLLSPLAGVSAASSSQTVKGKLWTWVMDKVVVGGIPNASPKGDGAGHILELWRQCIAHGGTMLSVISCLEKDESIPPGFATLEDWAQLPGVVDYYTVPFIYPAKLKNPPEVEDAVVEALLTVCSIVHNALPLFDGDETSIQKNVLKKCSCSLLHIGKERGQSRQNDNKRCIVYIMCKTGRTRGWVFAMAYLMSQYDMKYNEADEYLRQLRPFEPSDKQVEFALRFSNHIKSGRRVEQPSEEQAYIALLAQVLSLSPSYQERLLRDLEKLT